MCGKFTAMASWAEVVSFSQPLTVPARDGGGEDENDYEVTYRPYAMLPVIVWDAEAKQRRVIPMRWGLPEPKNHKVLKHIHARGETIDTKTTFAPLFKDGRRGIVVMKTFNETPFERDKEQWTINPQDGRPRGFAFLCQGYKNEETGEEIARMLHGDCAGEPTAARYDPEIRSRSANARHSAQ